MRPVCMCARREIERREIELIFEPKSGLRKNTIYQMVFNGVIKACAHAGGC